MQSDPQVSDNLILLRVYFEEGGVRIQLAQFLRHARLLLAVGFDLAFECGLARHLFE